VTAAADARKRRTMKRALIACLLTTVTLFMAGCPIYPSDNLCHSHWDCAPGYTCDQGSGTCVAPAPACVRPADCTNENETCALDGTCQIGSCRLVGCVAGFTCAAVNGAWTCTEGSASGSGGSSSIGGASATGGANAEGDAGVGGTSSTETLDASADGG
jgi:hypothetical protein